VVQAPALNAEAAAQEAAAALAVAVALAQSLPKFISPYLPALLEHTLNPVVRLHFVGSAIVTDCSSTPVLKLLWGINVQITLSQLPPVRARVVSMSLLLLRR
jgi:hypothetical protein